MIDPARQYELMFDDLIRTIADRKRTIFDLSRWIVTLQGIVIATAASKEISFSAAFVIAPLLIGMIGLMLHSGLNSELSSHRHALAVLRDRVSGPFAELNADFQNAWLHAHKRTDVTYWSRITMSHRMIILGSTAVASLASIFFV